MKKFLRTGFLLIIAVIITMYNTNSLNNKKEVNMHKGKPIEKVACSYLTNDLQSLYGYCDYVAIVKVNTEKTTKYKNVTDVGGGEKFGIPYTVYCVTVEENIKGKLPKGEEIEVTKSGGLTYAGDKYYVDYGDILPEEDGYYVMAFCVQDDGTLLASGIGSAKEITYGKIWGNDDIDKYIKLCDNSVNCNRKRYKYVRK